MPDTISLEQILNDAPDNFVIQDALIRYTRKYLEFREEMKKNAT